MNAAQKGNGSLIIASRNRTILLEFLKEILNQMTPLIHRFIILSRLFAMPLRRNDRLNIMLSQIIQYPLLGIVGDSAPVNQSMLGDRQNKDIFWAKRQEAQHQKSSQFKVTGIFRENQSCLKLMVLVEGVYQ